MRAHKALGPLGLLIFLLAARDAEAYLDPSTGSMVISAIVGLFASLALAVKTYWYRIKGWFRRRPPAIGTGADEHAD